MFILPFLLLIFLPLWIWIFSSYYNKPALKQLNPTLNTTVNNQNTLVNNQATNQQPTNQQAANLESTNQATNQQPTNQATDQQPNNQEVATNLDPTNQVTNQQLTNQATNLEPNNQVATNLEPTNQATNQQPNNQAANLLEPNNQVATNLEPINQAANLEPINQTTTNQVATNLEPINQANLVANQATNVVTAVVTNQGTGNAVTRVVPATNRQPDPEYTSISRQPEPVLPEPVGPPVTIKAVSEPEVVNMTPCDELEQICWEQCGRPKIFPFRTDCRETPFTGKITQCVVPPGCTCVVPERLRHEDPKLPPLITCRNFNCGRVNWTRLIAGSLDWCKACGNDCGGFQQDCINKNNFCKKTHGCSALSMCKNFNK